MLPEEREKVFDLLMDCRATDYSEEKGFFGFSPERLSAVLDATDTTLVALDGGEIVGTISLTGPLCGSLVVSREHRKRGIGAALLEAATKRAEGRSLIVAIPTTHVSAMRAFARAGFESVGVVMERA